MSNLRVLAAVVALSTASAHAAILDFEDFGLANGEDATVAGSEFLADFGITFSSTDRLRIVEVGGPALGFWPNDTPDPADAFGQFFLGTAFDDGFTTLTIDYANPVRGMSFDLGDIDGPEVFMVEVFDAMGNSLASRTIRAGDPGTGDQSVYSLGFSNLGADIARIVLEGERSRGNLGIAFDNFSVDRNMSSEVPLPASAALYFIGACVLALRRTAKAMRAVDGRTVPQS